MNRRSFFRGVAAALCAPAAAAIAKCTPKDEPDNQLALAPRSHLGVHTSGLCQWTESSDNELLGPPAVWRFDKSLKMKRVPVITRSMQWVPVGGPLT